MDRDNLRNALPEIDYARHLATGRRLRSQAMVSMLQRGLAWFRPRQRPALRSSQHPVRRSGPAIGGRAGAGCA
ncbi:MAG: hypothetical protein R3E87_06995 [Burkholderiaceae bacterium]